MRIIEMLVVIKGVLLKNDGINAAYSYTFIITANIIELYFMEDELILYIFICCKCFMCYFAL